jgi:hypothetical protein
VVRLPSTASAGSEEVLPPGWVLYRDIDERFDCPRSSTFSLSAVVAYRDEKGIHGCAVTVDDSLSKGVGPGGGFSSGRGGCQGLQEASFLFGTTVISPWDRGGRSTRNARLADFCASSARESLGCAPDRRLWSERLRHLHSIEALVGTPFVVELVRFRGQVAAGPGRVIGMLRETERLLVPLARPATGGSP